MHLINAHADVSTKARGLKFSLRLHLQPYFVYKSSEGSSKSVHSPEPSLLTDAIKINISCTGPNDLIQCDLCKTATLKKTKNWVSRPIIA